LVTSTVKRSMVTVCARSRVSWRLMTKERMKEARRMMKL
jgi:hypothetical protein